MAKSILLTLCLVLVRVSTASAGEPDTKRMVLTLSDLPAGFSVTTAHYMNDTRAANGDSTLLKSYVTWGRITGYQVDFEKGGLATMTELVSSASLYRTAHGAHLSTLDSVRLVTAKPSKGTTITSLSTGGRIGQETYFYKMIQKQGTTRLVAYAVLWREGNVKSSVLVRGLGLTDPALAIQLARKQEARIRLAGR